MIYPLSAPCSSLGKITWPSRKQSGKEGTVPRCLDNVAGNLWMQYMAGRILPHLPFLIPACLCFSTLQVNRPPDPPAGMPANILARWQRFSAWCGAKKRLWFFTKPMRVVGPLGVSYQQLEAFYEYSWALLLVNTVSPFFLLATWYLTGLACTWHPSRQYLPQDLCFVPGFDQVNVSSWPLDRFHQTNGSEQVAARYLESVMVGPTALTDHIIAIRQQRRKIEKSPYSQRSQLPENLSRSCHSLRSDILCLC